MTFARGFAVLAAAVSAAGAAWLTAPAEAGDSEPEVHRIEIRRFAFIPAQLEVRPGDIIEWVNNDAVPHTSTAEDGAWDSEELSRGASYRVTVDWQGSRDYICAYHPHMTGRIDVVGVAPGE